MRENVLLYWKARSVIVVQKKLLWGPREGRMAGTLKTAEISSMEIFHKTMSPKIHERNKTGLLNLAYL